MDFHKAPPASPRSGPAVLEGELIEARDQLAAADALLHAESGFVSRLIGDQQALHGLPVDNWDIAITNYVRF